MTIHFCMYFAVYFSVAAFARSESNETGLTITAIPKARAIGVGDRNGSRNDQNDDRSKRAISARERDNILNAFNCGRSLVGASDITYLSWSSSAEDEVYNFIQKCDFSGKFPSTTSNYIFFRKVLKKKFGHKAVIDNIFETNKGASSIYVLQVGGAYKDCSASGGHYYAYKLSGASGFNPTITQYTTGNACTGCASGVNWCYNKLCRDDCSSTIPDCCPITNNVPGQCESSDLMCQSDPEDGGDSADNAADVGKAVNTDKPPGTGSASTGVKAKASIMMLVIVSAFNYCFL